MTKEVSITIEGTQIGAEEAPILITASGTYHMQNEKHYIQYEEQEEGASYIKNMIKIGTKKIEMTKKGAASSEMTFDLNSKTEVIYRTPYGSLFFEAQTAKIEIIEAKASLEVTMEYALYSNGDHISDNRTIIRIQPFLSKNVEEA